MCEFLFGISSFMVSFNTRFVSGADLSRFFRQEIGQIHGDSVRRKERPGASER